MKSKDRLRAIFTFAAIMLFFLILNAAEVGSTELERPIIKNNTLAAKDGSLLHGGTIWLYGWIPDKTTWALGDEIWKSMEINGLNIVRVACAYRPSHANNYSLDQCEVYLDKIVGYANKSGIYVIIDFHPTPGSYNMKDAKDFWNRFAPRYKDKKNVIYELVNEPVFSQPENYTDQNLRDFEELWKIADKNAPQTPIIIMTYCAVGKSGRTPRQVADLLQGIDWKKTVVGFHSYWNNSSDRIVDLKKYYPCFNTEFTIPSEHSRECQYMDGYKWHGSLMEKLGISWTQWNILDTKSNLRNLDSAIVDLKAKGLYWDNK